MAGTLVRIDFDRPPTGSIENLICGLMREARRRSGMEPQPFARAIRARCLRPPMLIDATIERIEEGERLPRSDVFFHALAVAGMSEVVSTLLQAIT